MVSLVTKLKFFTKSVLERLQIQAPFVTKYEFRR